MKRNQRLRHGKPPWFLEVFNLFLITYSILKYALRHSGVSLVKRKFNYFYMREFVPQGLAVWGPASPTR